MEFASLMALGASFSVGLMGGFGHCTFMCGGFALSYSARASRQAVSAGSPRWWLGWLQYHLGRWTTYGFLAFALGLGGTVFEVSPAARRAWAVALGLILIVQALTMWRPGLLNLIPKPIASAGGALAQRLSRALPPSGSLGLWGAGIAWGFLPCGFSWAAIVGAAALGPISAMLSVLAFGLGTSIALSVVALSGQAIQSRLGPQTMRYAAATLLLAFGLWTAGRPFFMTPATDWEAPSCHDPALGHTPPPDESLHHH